MYLSRRCFTPLTDYCRLLRSLKYEGGRYCVIDGTHLPRPNSILGITFDLRFTFADLTKLNFLVSSMNTKQKTVFYIDYARPNNAHARSPVYVMCIQFNLIADDCNIYFDFFKVC